MVEKFYMEITGEIVTLVPSLFVTTILIDGITVRPDVTEDLEKQKKVIIEEWKGTAESDLGKNFYINVYRDLARLLGTDPEKMLPAVEAMLCRGILKGVFPRINSVVDTANIVSLKRLLPIGVFDADEINGKVVLELSSGLEKFLPIGSKKDVKLPPRVPLLVDEIGVFSAVGHRDSQRTMITNDTKKIMVFSWGIDPVDRAYVEKTLEELAGLLLNVS